MSGAMRTKWAWLGFSQTRLKPFICALDIETWCEYSYRYFLTVTTVVMKDILVSHGLWLDKNVELKYVKIINCKNEGKR